MEEILVVLSSVVNFWYIALPISVFLMFGARYTTKLTFITIGFLVGLNVVFPWLSSYEFFRTFLEKVGAGGYLSLIVVSLLTGILFYVLYRYLVFAGAFFLIFIPLLLFERTLVQRFNLEIPHWKWTQYVLPTLVSALAGYTAYRREEEFSRVFSVTMGSLVFSLLLLCGTCKLLGIDFTVEKFVKDKILILIYSLMALSLELLALRLTFGTGRSHRGGGDGTKTVR